MLKKICIPVIVCLVVSCATALFAQSSQVNIAVIKSLDIEPYRLAFSGFKQSIPKETNANYIEYNLEGNGKAVNKEKLAQEIKAKPLDLILAIGSGATSFALGNFKDKPIVFCMVLNPLASGFVTQTEPGRSSNITGASMDIPIRKQFEVLRQAIPGLKRVVALYTPKETDEVIQRARRTASELNMPFDAIPISSEKDIMDALNKLANRSDALWALADSKVYTPQNTQFIILETLRRGTPFLGLSPSFVKAGALLSLSCNYIENGEQAAGLAVRVLKGEKPNNLAVTVPEKIEISINVNTAKHIKVSPPEEILKQAVNVF